MKKGFLFVLSALILFSVTGCSKKDSVIAKEDTSIEALQDQSGIPVKVQKIESGDMVLWDEYTGTVSGTDEMDVFALLGDNFSKVNVKIGDIVKKDEVLAEFSTENPQARYNQAKIGFETTEKTYNRMKRVYESGGISQQQLDEIEAQYNIARENFNATKQLVKVISPADGEVVDVYFNQGDMNDPKRPFCKIVKTGRLKTTVFIEEEKIARYKKGQEVRVKWDGITDKEFKGTISKISLSSNPAARGFSVEISIDNQKGELMPGVFVYVYTPAFKKNSVISVPRDAVFNEQGKDYVYIADNGTAKKTEITLGKGIGNVIEVTGGLSEGDGLISEGRSLLKDGSMIIVVN